MSDEILTRHELAKKLNLSSATIRKYARLHGLPEMRLGYNTVRYKYVEVLAWMETREKAVLSEFPNLIQPLRPR